MDEQIPWYSGAADIADIDLRDKYGATPMHCAARNGDIYIMKALKQKNADINALDKDRQTPIFYAAMFDRVEAIKWLHDEHGTDVNAKNIYGATPIHYAARQGRVNAMKALRERGAEINARDNRDKTPLDYAIENRQGEAMYGVADDAKYKYNATIMHYAASKEDVDALRELHRRGVDINARDDMGKTPMDYAINHGRTLAVKCLTVLGLMERR